MPIRYVDQNQNVKSALWVNIVYLKEKIKSEMIDKNNIIINIKDIESLINKILCD